MSARTPLLFLILLIACGCGSPDKPDGTPIILITMDTTRADRLSCYGYERQTSPNLDRLAAESTMYTRAYSSSSWTLPAHASLLTAKFPTSHGAQYDPEGPLKLTSAIQGPDSWAEYRARGIATDETTLAELLREDGYATGAVVAGPWLKRVFSLDRGFDHYDDSGIDQLNGKLAEQVTDSALSWIRKHRSTKFFLFLNYYDPHLPYMPPMEYRDHFVEGTVTRENVLSPPVQNAFYDAEILYMDHHLGRLFDKLRAMDLYDESWIIVTADHGDLLGEHGRFGHGETLTEQEIHIPLLIKYPRGADGNEDRGPAAERVDSRVQITDIMPTILDRLGIGLPPSAQGQSLDDVQHPIVAEVSPVPIVSDKGDWLAIYDGDFKYLWNSKGNSALFNLRYDAEEKNNLRVVQKNRADQMQQALKGYLDSLPEPGDAGPAREIDEETRKALENMGYLKTGNAPPGK